MENRLLLPMNQAGRININFNQGKATITVPINQASQFFHALSEENVIQITHLEEAAERERRTEVEDN